MSYFGIWSVRSGNSVFGAAEAWCKREGIPEVFSTEADARKQAEQYNKNAASVHVRYAVMEMDPELALSALRQQKQTVLDVTHAPIYPHSVDYAREHGELDVWRESRTLNTACTQAIDQAVRDSNYELYHYDLKTAAQTVVSEFGADRVGWVLANVIRGMEYDGRISHKHKQWAQEQPTMDSGKPELYLNTHPAVLDGLIHHAIPLIEAQQKYNHLAAAEMTGEQNYNMIDGIPNNESSPKADLTDGQTFEEIRELAPEMLPEEKTSVLAQLREARETARCPKEQAAPASHKQKGEAER